MCNRLVTFHIEFCRELSIHNKILVVFLNIAINLITNSSLLFKAYPKRLRQDVKTIYMFRIDLLNYSELGKVSEVEDFLSNNSVDKLSMSSAAMKCIEARDFTQDHIETLKLLIMHGADVNYKDQRSQNCILVACSKGHLEAVRFLLSKGASAKEIDRQHRTTIMLALLQHNTDPIELIKLLHEKDADIYGKDMNSGTALHYAAMNGHKESLEYLISQRLDVNALDINNDTPLHLAFRNDRKSCIDVLIQLADKNIKNCKGKTPIEEAHGKSLAMVSSKKYVSKEEAWDTRRGRGGKQRGKGFKKKIERELGECSKCRQIAEVFCVDCMPTLSQFIDKIQDSAEKRKQQETEECLRVTILKCKSLEKENNEYKEALANQSNSYNVKVKKTAIYLRHNKEKPFEQIRDQLQGDIVQFVKDQERWFSRVEQCYSEAVTTFKSLIQDSVRGCNIEIFGSYATGLLLPYSDIDMVIQNVSTPTLQILKDLIPKIEKNLIVKKSDRIFTATIPLLKIHTEIKGQEVKVDITVQEPKHKGVDCTQLVKKYLGIYSTIKSVYMVLKQLMYFCNFHEPFKGGISSYGLFLLLVYLYQENMSDWNFANYEKQKSEADILIKFFEFYLSGYTNNKYVLIDYEGWDNREFKNKTVSFKIGSQWVYDS